ncbi:hypothetical protein MPSEU_000398700 [Mayamaea pseudoterrestris]|nr:hypothetical protein MPSEU_000398700 [Mayamaea pseudoterrestris]
MPTRITLKPRKTPAPSSSSRLQPASAQTAPLPDAGAAITVTNNGSPSTPNMTPTGNASSSSRRSIRRSSVYHRSSILRERVTDKRAEGRGDNQIDNQENNNQNDENEHDLLDLSSPTNLRLSSNDIRASPRLLGYLFCSIAAAVMFVSIVQFYRKQESLDIYDTMINPKNKYVLIQSSTDFIYRYKLVGALFLSAVGCVLTLLTVLVHFDTMVFPKVWNCIFRDGSRWEGGWIVFLVFYWAVNIHVCTSSFSVGQVQANVFFTAWLAFGSSVSCLEIWRESAAMVKLTNTSNAAGSNNNSSKPMQAHTIPTSSRGRFRLIGRFLDRPHHRATTSNWAWTGICSTVFAGAVTDMYYNRSALKLLYQGAKLIIDEQIWIIILAAVWAEVVLCFVSVFLNEWLYKPYRLPCRCRRRNQVYRCVYGWRQIEGLLMTLTLAGKFYVLLVYTGVDGPINGLSNGTWLRENKKISFIVREDDHEDEGEHEDAAINATFDYDYN